MLYYSNLLLSANSSKRKRETWSPMRGLNTWQFNYDLNSKLSSFPLVLASWKRQANQVRRLCLEDDLKDATLACVLLRPTMSAGVSGWSRLPVASTSARRRAQVHHPSSKLPGAAVWIWLESRGHLSQRMTASRGICSPHICFAAVFTVRLPLDQFRRICREMKETTASVCCLGWW